MTPAPPPTIKPRILYLPPPPGYIGSRPGDFGEDPNTKKLRRKPGTAASKFIRSFQLRDHECNSQQKVPKHTPKRGLGGALKESKYRQDVPIVVSLTKARPAIASGLQMRDQIELNPRGSTVLWPVGIILPPHHSSRARALPPPAIAKPLPDARTLLVATCPLLVRHRRTDERTKWRTDLR